MFCELSHTRAVRNSQTHIRNDPRDDINDSNDATDPVDDDSVTNYTRMIIISRDKKTGKQQGVDSTCLSRDLCVLPHLTQSRDSVLRCQIIYNSQVSTNISPVCPHSALYI